MLIEDAFVNLPPVLLPKGHVAVNNEIRTRLGKDPLPGDVDGQNDISVPGQAPAAIEPIWFDNRLVLPKSAVVADLDRDTFRAVLLSLRNALTDLATMAEEDSNIDRRAVEKIKRLADKIPDEIPPQDILFTIAHGLEWLSGYQVRVNEEWPNVLATQYSATALQYERSVRQFPRWREFVRNAETDRIQPIDVGSIVRVADEVISVLREPAGSGIVDPQIPDALERLKEEARSTENELGSLDSVVGGNYSAALDVVESVDNIAKRLAEDVLERTRSVRQMPSAANAVLGRLLSSNALADGLVAYREAFIGELPKAMREAGKEHAQLIPATVSAAIVFLIALALSGSGYIAAGAAGTTLAARKFAWLGRIVDLLRNKVP